MKKLLLPGLLVLGLLTGCDKSDDKKDDPFSAYARREMLASVRDQVVVPAYRDFAARAARLQVAVDSLRQHPTAATLDTAQAAWLTAVRAWKGVDLYGFGPAETLNTESGVAYPANPVVIENAVNTTAPIDQAYVDQKAASAKGLWALEYLLFRQNGGDAAVLQLLTADARAAQRRAYATAVATDVRGRADAIRAAWTSGSYPQQFEQADGNDVSSSIGLLANELVRTVEGIKNDQLGLPLGDNNGGVAQPAAVTAYESGESLAVLLASLDALEATLRGTRAGTAPAPGFDDLLDYLGAQYNGQSLSGQITQQIAAVRTQALALRGQPLADRVQQNPQSVRDLQNAVKQLTVLLKVDMISRLGVQLTFNDNDGD